MVNDNRFLKNVLGWGDTPKIILTLLDNTDLTNKDIYLFATSASSGITTSVNTIKNYKSNLNIIDSKRFSFSVTQSEVEDWLK